MIKMIIHFLYSPALGLQGMLTKNFLDSIKEHSWHLVEQFGIKVS